MPLQSVQGQTRALDALRAALKSDSVHHAYLFGGPEGVGKELTAVALAQALNCEAKTVDLDACGQCSSCVRIGRRAHPDVSWVMPEEELVSRGWAGRADFTHTPSRDIRVEQIRSLQERLVLRALEAPRKVAIIASAQAMNPQAQNAFLKTLEEPPANTVLILVASAPDRLLPTIRSRCSKVTFGPLPVSLIAERVGRERKLDQTTAQLVAVMAAGSMARALDYDVDGLGRRREVIEQFERLSPADARGWLQFAEQHGESRDTAEHTLRILAVWTRDLVAAQAGSDQVVNRDLFELVQGAAFKVSAPNLHRRMMLVDQAYNAVTSRNGAARLQLERMMIELMGS